MDDYRAAIREVVTGFCGAVIDGKRLAIDPENESDRQKYIHDGLPPTTARQSYLIKFTVISFGHITALRVRFWWENRWSFQAKMNVLLVGIITKSERTESPKDNFPQVGFRAEITRNV